MPVTDVQRDEQLLTMTLTAEFDVPAERAWQLFADPRQLERWWGPPGYPATFEAHDLAVGGTVRYFMTGPDGPTPRAAWRVLAVEPPRRLEVEDVFLDASGAPDPAFPAGTMLVTIADRPGGVTVTIENRFPSAEAMAELLAMGQEEGMRQAMGQIDGVLAEPAGAEGPRG